MILQACSRLAISHHNQAHVDLDCVHHVESCYCEQPSPGHTIPRLLLLLMAHIPNMLYQTQFSMILLSFRRLHSAMVHMQLLRSAQSHHVQESQSMPHQTQVHRRLVNSLDSLPIFSSIDGMPPHMLDFKPFPQWYA